MRSILKKYLQVSKTITDRKNTDILKSKSEGIQEELKIPEFMNVKEVNMETIRRDNSDFRIPIFLSNQNVTKTVEQDKMRQAEVDRIREKIKAMTPKEKIVVVEALPVDICLDRIKTEYEKNQLFIKSIKESFSLLDIDM